MREALAGEIRRTFAVFERIRRPFDLQPGASVEELRAVEDAIGFAFEQDLRDFFLFTNGLDRHCVNGSDQIPWFATGALGGELRPLMFPGLRVSFAAWRQSANAKSEAESDRPLRNHWSGFESFPIAVSPSGEEGFAVESNPPPGGRLGRIVWCERETQRVAAAHDGFLDFFAYSNDLLEHGAPEDLAPFRTWFAT